MLWVPLALLTAVLESAKDVLSKLHLRQTDAYLVAWAWRCFALPFLIPPLLFLPLPRLESAFWWALLVSGALNAISAVLYMQALKASDLSLTVPMIAFSPLFLLLTSPLLLGEAPGWRGAAGVLLIVAGSYRLGSASGRRGFFAPLHALLAERGPRLMLLVALIWSISANIDKIGVLHSSPLHWAAALNAAVAMALLPVVVLRCRSGRPLPRDRRGLLLIGAAGGLGSVCQMAAISLTLVPYVIAIKRSSTVMSVLWGHLRLGEAGIRQRLPAALMMLAGILLITLG